MSTKEIKSNVTAVGRGIKKFYKVCVGLVEAVAWLGLLTTAYTVIYCSLKNYILISPVLVTAVGVFALVITLRLAYEGAKYFRDLGIDDYER